MSDTLTILEVNAETGEKTIRELTTKEITELVSLQSEIQGRQAEMEAKAAARTSALAKLADLGLTAEEIAAL
jgi:molybdate-binding protein